MAMDIYFVRLWLSVLALHSHLERILILIVYVTIILDHISWTWRWHTGQNWVYITKQPKPNTPDGVNADATWS